MLFMFRDTISRRARRSSCIVVTNTITFFRQHPLSQPLLLSLVTRSLAYLQGSVMSPDGVMPLPDFRELAKKPRKKDREQKATKVRNGETIGCAFEDIYWLQ